MAVCPPNLHSCLRACSCSPFVFVFAPYPMLDKFHEECGVVAIYGHPEASKLAYLSLYAMQHRGQESAGICTSDGEVHTHKSCLLYTSRCV